VPEGHTVHRLAREHRARFGDSSVAVSSPQGRFAAGAALLDGRRLESTDAYGKHLFLGFGADQWLHVHLGLYGSWTFGSLPAPPPRGALRLRLEGNQSYADLRGPTACDLVTDIDKALIQGPARVLTHYGLAPTPSAPGCGSRAAAPRSASC
jgi:endonuclease-8